MKKSLVVARVGRNSLHRCWIDPGKLRDWDLYLCPFQEIPDLSNPDYEVGDIIPGPKWTGLRQLLNTWDRWRDYDYIWLPDDDIFTNQDSISAFFKYARALNFHLCAPTLHESSHYAHYITMRNQNFFARRVGFVEIMMPCFSRSALDVLLPTFDLSSTGWGWGLDSLWPKRLGYENLGIIDGISVLHTRAVGQFRDAELARRVNEEADRIHHDEACGQRMVTLGGIDSHLEEMSLSPDALIVALAGGWQYLLAREPKVLRWLVEHQRPFFDWEAYPIAGSPTSPL